MESWVEEQGGVKVNGARASETNEGRGRVEALFSRRKRSVSVVSANGNQPPCRTRRFAPQTVHLCTLQHRASWKTYRAVVDLSDVSSGIGRHPRLRISADTRVTGGYRCSNSSRHVPDRNSETSDHLRSTSSRPFVIAGRKGS